MYKRIGYMGRKHGRGGRTVSWKHKHVEPACGPALPSVQLKMLPGQNPAFDTSRVPEALVRWCSSHYMARISHECNAMSCGVIWSGVDWFGLIWCNMVQSDVVWYAVMNVM